MNLKGLNKRQLQSRTRSVGIAYILIFIAGAHYVYLNKLGTQILFWLTLGGLGIWWLIDVFRLSEMVHEFNDPIFDEIEWLESQEGRDNDPKDDFKELERKHWERRNAEQQERQYRDQKSMDDFV